MTVTCDFSELMTWIWKQHYGRDLDSKLYCDDRYIARVVMYKHEADMRLLLRHMKKKSSTKYFGLFKAIGRDRFRKLQVCILICTLRVEVHTPVTFNDDFPSFPCFVGLHSVKVGN